MTKKKCAVIVIDMLEDFVYGVLKNDRAKRIIPNIAKLLDFARAKGWLVVYANDAHQSGLAYLKMCYGATVTTMKKLLK